MNHRETDSANSWQLLLSQARGNERDTLQAILDRSGPIELEQIIEAATAEELQTVASFLTRITAAPVDSYDRHKARIAENQRRQSASGRDIGPLPLVADPDRRAACENDLALYLKTYHPRAFTKPFCEDQLRAITKIQVACLEGALFAFAMPRGQGKTTIAICAAIWSAINGHHRFTFLVGATEEKATKLLLSIQTNLRFNRLLAEDFPEVCYPIYRLEGINQRAKGQLLNGEPTSIVWKDAELVLPTVSGSKASGSVIGVGGLLTAVRGAQHLTIEGDILRPSFVLIDDPQTRESANSTDQSETRIEIIEGDVLGMAGPGEPLAAVMPCTVIRKGDAVDCLLDRESHPEWRGERTSMIDQLPTNLDLWDDYFDILDRVKFITDETDDTLREIRREATAFYVKHQARMDAGCVAAWPERFLPWEASAIQHAMNLYHRNEAAFWAEYMNKPLDPYAAEEEFASAEDISLRLSGYARGVVPLDCRWVTAFVDVHHRILYWMIVAWEPTFTGYVIDYGTFPEQGRKTFKGAKASPTLRQKFPNRGLEGAISAGLTALVDEQLMTRRFLRVDDAEMAIALCPIDAGDKTEVVRKWCRESPNGPRVIPAFGRGIGPNQKRISTYQQRPGEQIGDEWQIRSGKGKRSVRHLIHDVNFYKTFLQRRLATPAGDRGSLTIYGKKGSRTKHDFLARHLTAELRKRVVGDRPVDIWEMKPGESENHWLDCAVGNCVAASMLGAQITGATIAPVLTKKRTREAEYL